MPQSPGVRHRRLDVVGQARARDRGKLIFAGKAGTGFGLAAGRELAERLRKIERDTPPFVSVPRAYQRGARWVDPRLVAEVAFTTWTTDNLLRLPSCEGLREDTPAREVKLERPRQAKRS